LHTKPFACDTSTPLECELSPKYIH
jgi:hypothetical protein